MIPPAVHHTRATRAKTIPVKDKRAQPTFQGNPKEGSIDFAAVLDWKGCEPNTRTRHCA
jgi:hypothetical protein